MGIKYCVPQTVHMDTTPEKRMKFAEVIIRKCDEVSALTNDLFLHALSDMDKLEMNMHEVKLCAFMRKAVAELISDMDSVRLILPDSEWVISADEKRLMQLTENILNNAAKYGEMPVDITIDTIDAHYWNYKIDPKKLDKSWGDSIYTDFSDFNECSLKMCVEIFNQDKADKLARSLSDCDCIRFSDGFWYKFTKKNVTKENAIMKITEVCGFSTDSIIAFGDDYADIGMLELCGTGVAMGNTICEDNGWGKSTLASFIRVMFYGFKKSKKAKLKLFKII